jgi:hypothetical protein
MLISALLGVAVGEGSGVEVEVGRGVGVGGSVGDSADELQPVRENEANSRRINLSDVQ